MPRFRGLLVVKYMAIFQADVQALLDDLIPFACQMLSEEGEFLPFGACTNSDGSIVWEGASNGDELPLSRELIDILHNTHRKLAATHEIRACAVVYDIRAVPPGKGEKQDAICVAIDHITVHSIHQVYPYRIDASGNVEIDESYTVNRKTSIFSRPNA